MLNTKYKLVTRFRYEDPNYNDEYLFKYTDAFGAEGYRYISVKDFWGSYVKD